MERLQKVIANSGYCSRRKAEELICNGEVKVNGKIVTELGTCVDKSDAITVSGKSLTYEQKEYILLNKPRGVITSTNDEKGRKTVLDLIDTDKRLYPVGRLDYDTTGALLLTNDGELANLLMHPKNNIEKLYIAKVNGFVDKDSLIKLAKGVYIDNFKTSKANVRLKKYDKKTNTSIVEIIIHEGKNHQIKKMLESVGNKVIKLRREKYANLNLKGLMPGEYRPLTIKEVKILYSLCKK